LSYAHHEDVKRKAIIGHPGSFFYWQVRKVPYTSYVFYGGQQKYFQQRLKTISKDPGKRGPSEEKKC